MNKETGQKVPFTAENITRCMCPRCPVQTDSECVSKKLGKLDDAIKMTGKGSIPKPDEVPAVYCSAGVAGCKDLDFSQMCICGSCSVWHQYNLVSGKPVYYFCRDGKAH